MVYGIQAVIAVMFFLFLITSPAIISFIFLYHSASKKTYLVLWCYCCSLEVFSTIVKAKSVSKAWEEIEKQHYFAISCIKIKEIRE
jgi:hypothetical protein